jgi:hypothetical protein
MSEYYFDPEYWLHEIEDDEAELQRIDEAILAAFDELQEELDDRYISALLWDGMKEGDNYDY